jgi:hypothetical protein
VLQLRTRWASGRRGKLFVTVNRYAIARVYASCTDRVTRWGLFLRRGAQTHFSGSPGELFAHAYAVSKQPSSIIATFLLSGAWAFR